MIASPLIQLSVTSKLWRRVKQQSLCLYLILQHCHLFHHQIQEPKGIGTICSTCNDKATEVGQTCRLGDPPPGLPPVKVSSLPTPHASEPQHSHTMLSCHPPLCPQACVSVHPKWNRSGIEFFKITASHPCNSHLQKSVQQRAGL